MNHLLELLKEFWKHLGKYFKWFFVLLYLIITIDIAFTLMNTDSSILFYSGIAIILFDLSFTIFVIKKQINTNK